MIKQKVREQLACLFLHRDVGPFPSAAKEPIFFNRYLKTQAQRFGRRRAHHKLSERELIDIQTAASAESGPLASLKWHNNRDLRNTFGALTVASRGGVYEARNMYTWPPSSSWARATASSRDSPSARYSHTVTPACPSPGPAQL